jgi:hypothetical protein
VLETTRMHSRNSRLLALVTAGALALALLDMLWARQWLELVRYSGPVGLFGLLLWAALWSPYVECSPAGVHLHNVVTSVRVPWPAIRGIDPRFGLSLDTVYGTFAAWSASRPRLQPGRRDESDVHPAAVVAAAWEQLKAAGHLDNPRLESHGHPRRLRGDVLGAALGLVVWTAATLVLLT